MNLPRIIQGGMGVAISDWKLAKTVSQLGQLGVVSGTGISKVMIGRLMDGDPEGHVQRALRAFPYPGVADRILNHYYIPGGKAPNAPYKNTPAYTLTPPRALDEITVAGNFVEVFLAKEGHDGLVGINLLEKIQMPTMASLYGALLANVDYVLMGAGIPVQIPGILDKLALHQDTSYRVDVTGADKDDDFRIHFSPEKLFPGIAEKVGPLHRAKFLPIISSVVLAQALLKRSEGEIHGWVIEGNIAGGHNAPPRGPLKLNEIGEPIYGEKDEVDLEKMKAIGLPFWLAGGYGHADQLQRALDAGAAGIQVGTAFAFCNESGMYPPVRQAAIDKLLRGEGVVFTDPNISPTGFPFKVVQLEGTISEDSVYDVRERICDMGFLRTLYKREDGKIGYRCPAEPVDDYVKKGGALEDTVGRSCLCNNLGATAGFGQHRKNGYVEQPLVTAGNDYVNLMKYIPAGQRSYSARDVVMHLLEGVTEKA